MKRIQDMFMSFKDIRNDEVGAQLIGMPIRQESAVRGSKQTIPGRDGFLLIPNGWQEITVKQDLFVPASDSLEEVKSWLTGSGDLVFGDNPEYAYEASIITPIALSSISKRLEGVKFTVTFTCQPFLHQIREKTIELTSGSVFNGYGNINSLPLIKVEGSGTSTLIVNERSMILELVSGLPLYLDCDAGTAYTLSGDEMVFAGEQVTVLDDWFELRPRSRVVTDWNNVNFTSGISRVTLTPRWRWM